MFKVFYVSMGETYESDCRYETRKDAEEKAAWLRTFGYVGNVWVE